MTGTVENFRISIVIVNYNYGRFLRQAIDSCLNQTRPAHEIIVVDDGSTDNSRALLDTCRADPRIKIILQENQGQAAALQRGFDEATGDWILGLDADDCYLPECLEEITRHMRPDTFWIYFRARKIDERGNPSGLLPSSRLQLLQGDIARQWLLEGALPSMLPQSFNCYSAEFIKSNRIVPNPLVDSHTAMAADMYLCLEAIFHGPAVAIDRCLGCYRDHSAGRSKQVVLHLPGIRSRLRRDSLAESLIQRQFEKKFGPEARLHPRHAYISLNAHWELRLISLLADPQGHPHPGDSRTGLLLRAVRSVWTESTLGMPARASKTVKLGLMTLFPFRAWSLYQLRPLHRIRSLIRL